MSNSHLVRWFDALLFGKEPLCRPPVELTPLLLRIEAEHISWEHLLKHGGLTAFPYNVHGDLSSLIDFLEKKWLDHDEVSALEPGPFRTRDVSRFWNQLQVLLARKLSSPSELPVPLQQDDAILKELLVKSPDKSTYSYQSPSFWGELARRFLNVHRPLKDLTPLTVEYSDVSKKTTLLYDVTCQSRGQYWDPLSLYMVPASEYLNPINWQSDLLLQDFMKHSPLHPLTKSVQNTVRQAIDQVIHGERPTMLLETFPSLETLLYNIQVIHTAIPEVPFQNEPPKLIDVFQRLLALCHRDDLWEKVIPPSPITEPVKGMDLFLLTERLRILDRENKLLWKYLRITSDSGPREHISSNSYANSIPTERERVLESNTIQC